MIPLVPFIAVTGAPAIIAALALSALGRSKSCRCETLCRSAGTLIRYNSQCSESILLPPIAKLAGVKTLNVV